MKKEINTVISTEREQRTSFTLNNQRDDAACVLTVLLVNNGPLPHSIRTVTGARMSVKTTESEN